MSEIKNRLRDISSRTPLGMHKIATNILIAKLKRPMMREEQVEEAYRNSVYRDLLISKYCKRNGKYADRAKRMIERVLSTNEKYLDLDDSDIMQIKKDMLFCRFAYGTQIDEYVFMDFWEVNRNDDARRKIVSDTEQHIVRLACNDITCADLSDKARAYSILHEYYKRDVAIIRHKDDIEEYNRFINNNPSFVVKRVFETRGRGVEKVNSSEINKDYFNNLLHSGKVMLEGVIEQSDEISSFNCDSVNTARVSSFLTKDGVVVPWGFFRTGRKGSFVDNCAAGGVFASIDTANGILSSQGCDEFGRRYEFHPDSGKKFEGFQLPDWNNALSICKSAAIRVPNIVYKLGLSLFKRIWLGYS